MGRILLSTASVAALLASLSSGALAQSSASPIQRGGDMWRASKLPGVTVYGPDGRRVGNISDVLMGHDGKAIVIGVGGFLGIGEKDVAVPFDQVKFTDRSIPQPGALPAAPAAKGAASDMDSPPAAAADTPTGGITTLSGRVAPGVGTAGAPASGTPSMLGTPAASTTGNAVPGAIGMAAVPTGPVGGPNRGTSYPDHGTIAFTAGQLEPAPSFQFAKRNLTATQEKHHGRC